MKNLLPLLISFMCSTVVAQNFSVSFYSGLSPNGTNDAAFPFYWPLRVQPIGTSTNIAAGFVLMTSNQLYNCVQTNSAAKAAWDSNQNVLSAQAMASATASNSVYSVTNNLTASHLLAVLGFQPATNVMGQTTNLTVLLTLGGLTRTLSFSNGVLRSNQ